MQSNVMQVPPQPFMKLAQANIELLTRFSTSPEFTAQASANASQLFQQASETTMKVMQSGAFAQMMQGMLKNYTEFLSELGRGGMGLWSQGQAVMTEQVQQATRDAIEASDVRGRRQRG